MLAKIDTLIDKLDTVEIINRQIAAILASEVENQEDLASKAGKNPEDFAFDVYRERSKPWEALSDNNGEEIGDMPLVNVCFDNTVYDNRNSNTVEFQHAVSTFYIDCYAHKNKTKDHESDVLTSDEADRIARLARNIIMADVYTYLGMRKIVFKRYVKKIEKMMPTDREGKPFEKICGSRLTVEVDFNEFSPQSIPSTVDLICGKCTYKDTGLVLFEIENSI
jgi:hypothetical protein